MRTLALVLLVLLVGCAEPPDPPGWEYGMDIDLTEPHRFTVRPPMVQASLDLPEECKAGLDEALWFFRAHGVTITLEYVSPSTPALNGIHQRGVISVKHGELGYSDKGEEILGEARPTYTILGNVYSASVVLDSCDPLIAGHEIAHALGLVHSPEVGNLMHADAAFVGWELTDEQVAWVAD